MTTFSIAIAAAVAGILAATAAASAQNRPTRDKFMFEYADRNGDGVLSPGEFGLVLHPAAAVGATPKSLYGGDVDSFARADADRSGGLDREEFAAWFRQSR